MDAFVGRDVELRQLKQLLHNATSNFVVVRGRRRIGKSRLVEEFAKPYTYYKFEGLMPRANIGSQDQRDEFARQLKRYFDLPTLAAPDWGELFITLAQQVQKNRRKPIVILFDELSWMAEASPDFLGQLKIAWDNHFSKNPKLILFLCSSVSPWIEKNLVGSSGYLGRPTLDITLRELPLAACKTFVEHAMGDLSPYELLKILSVTGGVPRYLELLNKRFSAQENLKNLFFNASSPLFNEFEYIFADIYSARNALYKRVILALANGAGSQKDIAESAGFSQTGDLSAYLRDLELGGFITRDYTWSIASGHQSKLSHYRLSDNYSRFYLKYIEPNRARIEKGLFQGRTLNSLPGMDTIMGFQFENLVINNHSALISELGILPDTIIYAGAYFQRKTVRTEGCQIDYMIQTRDCVYVCEIKFSRHAIAYSIVDEVQRKLSKLKTPKYMSKRAVLVHVNGVVEEVEDDLFFSCIVSFEELLKPCGI